MKIFKKKFWKGKPVPKNKLIKIVVPIFTEEYKITAFLGRPEVIVKAVAEYLELPEEQIKNEFGTNKRGMAYNCYPNHNPVIMVDTTNGSDITAATMAHEACHGMDYIANYIGVTDTNGEFRAHGVSCVMRAYGNI